MQLERAFQSGSVSVNVNSRNRLSQCLGFLLMAFAITSTFGVRYRSAVRTLRRWRNRTAELGQQKDGLFQFIGLMSVNSLPSIMASFSKKMSPRQSANKT